MLIFAPDGSGRYEFTNWGLCTVEYFTWDVPEPGVIDITGIECCQLNADASGFDVVRSEFTFSAVPFRIAEEEVYGGRTLKVLRLTWRASMSDHYGLVRRDVAGFDTPVWNFERP